MDLAIRRTHRFVGTYQHEDDWESIGSWTVVASGTVHDDEEDPCDPCTTTAFIEVESPCNHADIEQALRDSNTKSGCHHEYDCCGCRSFRATDVEHLKDKLWKVTIRSSRNY